MSVSFKAPLKSSVVNAAFMSRTVDTDTIGKVGLANNDLVSGDAIVNAQRLINEIKDACGILGEGDTTANTYTEENFIVNGDSYKDAIDKIDQALQSLTETINGGLPFLLSYSTDGAFETAHGAPPYSGKTGIYYNSIDGNPRYYDNSAGEWKAVGSGGGIGVQESLGTGNGANTVFALTNAPTSDESIIVYRDGLVVDKAEWSFSNPNLTFTTPPPEYADIYVWYLTDGTPSTPVIGSGTDRLVYHTVTASEETAKQFTLPVAPADPTKTIVDVIGGASQEFGTDFIISGTTFDWSGYGLDSILVENDIVRLFYIV